MNTRRNTLRILIASLTALFTGKALAGIKEGKPAGKWTKIVVSRNGEAMAIDVWARPHEEADDDPTPVAFTFDS